MSEDTLIPDVLETYEVYYQKPAQIDNRTQFYAADEELTLESMKESHVFLRTVEAIDKDDAYIRMQGEYWSPNGEAQAQLDQLGLEHTSMSIGDVLVEVKSRQAWQCDRYGWKEVPPGARPSVSHKKPEAVLLGACWPIQPDQRDQEIANKRLEAFNRIPGMRVGDFCIMPDGAYERFSYDWGDAIQTCTEGSFYLGLDHSSGCGYASMSGGLNPCIEKTRIEEMPEVRDGTFWFFHHDIQGAHRSVQMKMPCRVFRVMP